MKNLFGYFYTFQFLVKQVNQASYILFTLLHIIQNVCKVMWRTISAMTILSNPESGLFTRIIALIICFDGIDETLYIARVVINIEAEVLTARRAFGEIEVNIIEVFIVVVNTSIIFFYYFSHPVNQFFDFLTA